MTSGPSSSLAGLLLLASRIACLIVIAWFVVFVVDQTAHASAHQQNEVSEGSVPAPSSKRESALHRTLDEASSALTSPFAGVASGSSSEWVTHIVRTVLALLVYGFGVAFLVRFIRVRV
jgi:predicted secreted protein